MSLYGPMMRKWQESLKSERKKKKFRDQINRQFTPCSPHWPDTIFDFRNHILVSGTYKGVT